MIHYQINKKFDVFDGNQIRSFAEKTLTYLDATDCDLSIVIGSNADIQILNRDYRHIDAPTDVLSFVYDVIDPDTNSRYLGDIVISAEKLQEQALDAGHSTDKELCILIVHGILHLYGYDHEAETGEAVMLPLQSKIIDTIFIKNE
jgi:probable rRNA maturation factor